MGKRRVRYGIPLALYGEVSTVLAEGSLVERLESQVICSSMIDEHNVDAREKWQ